jgi:hypothetical protein
MAVKWFLLFVFISPAHLSIVQDFWTSEVIYRDENLELGAIFKDLLPNFGWPVAWS